jgi:hypothetical protein
MAVDGDNQAIATACNVDDTDQLMLIEGLNA